MVINNSKCLKKTSKQLILLFPRFRRCKFYSLLDISQIRAVLGRGGHGVPPSTPPPSFSGAIFFLSKFGVDERWGVDDKSHSK